MDPVTNVKSALWKILILGAAPIGVVVLIFSIAIPQCDANPESATPAALHDTWPPDDEPVATPRPLRHTKIANPPAPPSQEATDETLRWMDLRNRDVRVDAAYSAGYSAATRHYRTHDYEEAVRSCTRELMACRHQDGTPTPDVAPQP